ncbi:MAG: hypothetical protein KBD78_15115 [Oligoflexales bacterium]|nr:hypothetical protein [Oligoflexales bacterium]
MKYLCVNHLGELEIWREYIREHEDIGSYSDFLVYGDGHYGAFSQWVAGPVELWAREIIDEWSDEEDEERV